MFSSRQILVLIFSLVISGITSAERLQKRITHNGNNRGYLLTVPGNYSAEVSMPLVIALHGRPGTAERMVELTGFDTRAEANGFLVAYPQGMNNYWNYLYGVENNAQAPDDVDYIVSVVNSITSNYNIDPTRIYIAGISNGGFMAQRMACHQPQLFAAFASVAATGYAYISDNCPDTQPISALYVQGTADTKTPWKGLSLRGENGTEQPVTLSMTDSLKFWSDKNHCGAGVDSKEVTASGRSPQTRVRILASQQCREASEVVLFAVLGGGHNWPGVPDMVPAAVAGQVNLDIHASDVIWSFFRDKTRSNGVSE